MPYTDEECARELKREIGMRKRLYPEWKLAGKITDVQSAERIGIMEQILAAHYAHALLAPKTEAPKADTPDLFGGSDA